MKILMVHSTEKVSGGENVSLGIAGCLRTIFDFIFFTPAKPISMDRFVGYSVFYPKEKGFVNSSTKLKEVIDSERPDIVHAQGTRAALFVKLAFIRGARRTKFVYTLHGIHFVRKQFPKSFISLLLERWASRLIDALVCVGKDDLNLAKKLHLIENNKLFLIENGVKVVEMVEENGAFLREELSLGGKKIIMTACRLHYQKDVKTLIWAMSILKDENSLLLIVGDGPERDDLEKLSAYLDLGSTVRFLGNRDDVDDILLVTDIFVLSTHWEGSPLVILEAWANRKPVVASDVHGVADLVEDNENGLLVKSGDPDDLAEKIDTLLSDGNLRSRLGMSGYDLVRTTHSVDNMAKEYKKLYLSLINENT